MTSGTSFRKGKAVKVTVQSNMPIDNTLIVVIDKWCQLPFHSHNLFQKKKIKKKQKIASQSLFLIKKFPT